MILYEGLSCCLHSITEGGYLHNFEDVLERKKINNPMLSGTGFLPLHK